MKKVKNILALALAFLMVGGNMAMAQEASQYELPVKLMRISKEDNKESMASSALSPTAKVVEKDGKQEYTIYLKPLEFMNQKGNVTNLFVLDQGNNKIEAKKATGNGAYPISFTFVRDQKQEGEIVTAIWVDVMDQMQGGKSGAGEQKARLVFDWSQAKKIGENKDQGKKMPIKSPKGEISIKVNGKKIESDVAPFVEKERTLVPIRFISENLGYKVDWDKDKNQVCIDSIRLEINGKSLIQADGSKKELDVASQIKDNRTFVPLRAIAEILGCKVDWDGSTKTVLIEKQ